MNFDLMHFKVDIWGGEFFDTLFDKGFKMRSRERGIK